MSIKRILIETVPHEDQRYDTIGDWIIQDDLLHVKTSDLKSWRMSMCCAIHEVIEAMLCHRVVISEETVSQFDTLYEARRQECVEGTFLHGPDDWKKTKLYYLFGCDCTPTEDSEPGEDLHAPYRKQHAFADGIERLLAMELGVIWGHYADRVAEASERYNLTHPCSEGKKA